MRIDKVEWFRYKVPAHKGGPMSKEHAAARVTTDDGARGWAELRHGTWDWFAQADAVSEALTGRDPSRIDALWDELYGAFHIHAVTLADIALWDLAGRAAGKPVHALLGTVRDRIRAYRSTPFNVGGPEDYARFALDCRQRGYHGCKLHPTHNEYWDERTGGDVEMDMDIYRAVREAVGPDWPVMTDPYHTYSFEEALRVGHLLDDMGFAWYESPMHEGAEWIERYVRLCAEIETPVCAPECQEGAHDTRQAWIDRGATDIGRIDIYYGGLTANMRLARACERAGLPIDLHLGNAYQLQVVGATSDDLYPLYEDYWWYHSPAVIGEEFNPPVVDGDGYAHVPQGPGMGIELDWDYIEANRTG